MSERIHFKSGRQMKLQVAESAARGEKVISGPFATFPVKP